MFCENCGSPLNGKNSFCGNCGAQVNNTPTNQGMPTRKKINPIIYIIPIVVIVIIAAVFIIFNLKKDNEAIYGKWECNDHMIFKFNSNKTFEIYEMYDKTELYVKGKYKIDGKSETTNSIVYSLVLTSNYRIVDGETYNSSNSITKINDYEAYLSTSNLDEMELISEAVYNTYYCEKVNE